MPSYPAWAPRVSPAAIRRLYQAEARGLLDDDLADEVGIALYARCESIIQATEAHRGRIDCPACGTTIQDPNRSRFAPPGSMPPSALPSRGKVQTPDPSPHPPSACPACGAGIDWPAIMASLKGKELVGGLAEPYFREYIEAYPRSRTPGAKMLLIDRLLHEFHTDVRFGDVRPAAVNVIEGRMRSVMALLDELAGFSSTPGQSAWRQRAPASVMGRARSRNKGQGTGNMGEVLRQAQDERQAMGGG